MNQTDSDDHLYKNDEDEEPEDLEDSSSSGDFVPPPGMNPFASTSVQKTTNVMSFGK
jgi:hypothetical protein